MNELVSEGKEKGQRVKLKSLLRQQPENLVTVDQIDKYDQANPLDIAVLNYLGQNISEAGIERLDNGENWKSIATAEYMLDIANKSGNNKLKKNIESLLKNTELKPEEIGIHALKELEKSLSRKELQDIKTKITEPEEKKEKKPCNFNVYLFPVNKNDYASFTFHNIPKNGSKMYKGVTTENVKINVYAPCERDEQLVDYAAVTVESHLDSFISDTKFTEGQAMGCSMLTACGIIPGITTFALLKRRHNKRKKMLNKLLSLTKAKDSKDINWYVDEDLKNIYDFAYKGGKLNARCKSNRLKRALELCSYLYENRSIYDFLSGGDEKLCYAYQMKVGKVAKYKGEKK